ncbi:MAG: urea ABC transporter permease subunit UrtC [SAR202 cluster bacterium]|nr:urea ABC transporter permease subunit UrtC [SAR202 cluster bacterium]
MRWSGLILAAALLAAAPFVISPYNLSLLGRFLALAILGLGIAIVWGYAGILSLGQGVFFGLGGYALAMHLKLVADGFPDFMVWNGVESLPWWWTPFSNPGFALAMVVVAPTAVAVFLGVLFFRRRVTGVYIALITQALALAFATLLISQQGSTGGFNGLTNFNTFLGMKLSAPHIRLALYGVTAAFLVSGFLAMRWMTGTHFGKMLVAIRDGENRVRFLGYDPSLYKTAAFGISALLAGVSGALFTLHLGVISPAMVGVLPSIEMVIGVAIGGREALGGAVFGTVFMNILKDRVSSAFPNAWLYVVGAMFVLVVIALPRGFAGLAETAAASRLRALGRLRGKSAPLARKAVAVEVAEGAVTVERGD